MAKTASAAKKRPAKKSPPKTAVRKKTAATVKKKAVLKTQKTTASVGTFLSKVDAKRRDDVRALDAMFERVVGEPGKMWGSSIVGYGSRVLTYPNGRTLDWMVSGFSPRAANLTLYVIGEYPGRDALLGRLGPHSTGKGCLYVKRLADVDVGVLEELVRAQVAAARAG
jgi:hypothetical protein